ncbi:MAG TPA: AAA family ATPase, partial [Herpetosiphonaceae bacterium]|nr:AAA family ATPase [Herpetosiphonaceae bacterium]
MEGELGAFALLADQELASLWEIRRASWALLQEQKSRFGSLYLPVHVFHQLRDERRALLALEAELKRRGLPPPASAGAPGPILGQPLINQLRAPLADFTGRAAELERLGALLQPPDSPRSHAILVRGMGGLGKTELVIQAAHQVFDHYPDGIFFVELRATVPGEARRVGDGLRDVLRQLVEIEPALLPDAAHRLATLYRQALAGKRILIIVDDAPDAATLGLMLPPAGCTLIATARPRLYLDGAALVDLEAFPLEDARRLVARVAPALAADPDLDSLIGRCGSLPLALRVAGAALRGRYPALSIARYSARLDAAPIKGNGPDVHAILGASSLLLAQDTPELARRWRMLHVCPSDFTAAIAARIWAEDDPDAAEDDLFALCDYSLLRLDAATACYDLYALLRDVARGQSGDDERALAARRHAQAVAEHCAEALPLLRRGQDAAFLALARMERIWPHLGTAVRWASRASADDPAAAPACLALTLAIRPLIDLHLPADQAVEWAAAAARAATIHGDQAALGQALRWRGNLLRELGDAAAALAIYAECLELARLHSDARLEGQVLGNLGSAYRSQARFAEARLAFEASLAIAVRLDDQAAIGKARGRLSTIDYWEGDSAGAVGGQEARRALAERSGDQREAGKAWGNLGLAYAADQRP